MGMKKSGSPPVRRGFNFQDFKALDEAQGRFSGYLAVFSNEDQGGDIIDPGAFKKNISDLQQRQQSRAGTPGANYMLPIFWAHKDDEPIGGFTAMREDEHGLYVEGLLDMDIEQGRRAYSGLTKGYIPGQSIGYFPVRFYYDRAGRRHLAEVAAFEGTITAIPMNDAAVVTQIKAASDADKTAQKARAKRYKIAIKDGGNVTKPGKWASVPDSQWGDPVNYRYPMPDKSHADDAASRFGAASAREQYSSDEQGIIDKRIARRQRTFGESSDAGKGKSMGKKPQRKDDDALVVGEDGTHAAFTGTHTHHHKAYGDQGDDGQHEHTHTHKGDANHDHEHKDDGDAGGETASLHGGAHKSADFATALTSLQERDTLQEDWHNLFQAFVDSAYSLVIRAVYGMGMTSAEDAGDTDPVDQAQANADAFGEAFVDLITRSVAAEFVPMLDDDCDSFCDPDDDDGYKAVDGGERKAGRKISQANAAAMQKALATIAAGHKTAAAGHKDAMSMLKTWMQPGADVSDSTDDGYDSNNGKLEPKRGDGKSAATRQYFAPGAAAPQSDTTQAPPALTADEIGQIIQRRMQATKLAAAVADHQRA